MQRSLSILVAPLLLSGALAAQVPVHAPAGASSPKSGTQKWFPTIQKDLGTYFGDEQAKGSFGFTNPFERRVEWSELRASCTCAKAEITVGDRTFRLMRSPEPNTLFEVLEKNGVEVLERAELIEVPPGAEGRVEVVMKMTGVKGQRTAFLDIFTEDEETPHLKLSFEATGAQMFTIEPAQVNLNKMRWDEEREFTCRISSPIAKDFEITGHDRLPEGMEIEFEKEMENGRAVWLVKGKYGPLETDRGSGGTIVLDTDIRSGMPVEVQVVAFVEGPLRIKDSSYLSMGLVRRGQGAKRSVSIEPTDDFDLQVEEIELSELTLDEDLVSVTTRKEGKTLVLEVGISGEAPRGLAKGVVTVHLNHPAAPEQQVNFSGFVR